MKVVWHPDAAVHLDHWRATSPRVVARIDVLLDSIKADPFRGIGKPEQLKFDLAGCWSRRITGEHRLVYAVDSGVVVVLSARYHY